MVHAVLWQQVSTGVLTALAAALVLAAARAVRQAAHVVRQALGTVRKLTEAVDALGRRQTQTEHDVSELRELARRGGGRW